MRRAAVGGVCAIAAMAVGACGGGTPAPTGPSASASAPASASASPTPSAPQTFVLLVQTTSAISARFVRRDGTELRTAALPKDTRFATVGGDRLFFVSAAHLHAMGSDGVDQDMGPLTGMDSSNPGWGGLAVSPDGTRWAWSFLVGDLSRPPMHSRMQIGGRNESARVVLDETKDATQYLEPIAWTAAGIVVADQPGNVGGGPLFFDDQYWWTTRLLDPAAGATRPLTDSQQCPFNDLAPDGSYTCMSARPAQVELTQVDGTRRLHIPGAVVVSGDALIDPSGRRIAVGIDRSDSTGQQDQQWDVGTDIIDIATDTATALPRAGQVPLSWLPDGSLVLADEVSPQVGPQNSASLLAPDLDTSTPLGPGVYLGALDADHAIAAHAPSG